MFQCQSYSHSDDTFIILRSNINTDTSIFVFSREKLHDSKYSKDASPKPQFISSLQIYHLFLQVYLNAKIVAFFPLMVIFIGLFYYKHQSHPFSLKVLFPNAIPEQKTQRSRPPLSRKNYDVSAEVMKNCVKYIFAG